MKKNNKKLNNRKIFRPSKSVVSGKKNIKEREEELYGQLHSVRIPRILNKSSPIPQFVMRKQNFFEPTLVLQGATTFLLREWRINALFDPDPLIGGGTVSGYSQFALLHNAHIVEYFRCHYDVAGNEPASPVVFGIIFRDVQPSTTILTHSNAVNALEQAPTDGVHIVGQTSGMDVFRSPMYKIKPGDIVGNPLQYLSNIAFASATNSVPTQLVWMAFIAISGTGGPLTNGCILDMYMEFTSRWYSPVPLA